MIAWQTPQIHVRKFNLIRGHFLIVNWMVVYTRLVHNIFCLRLLYFIHVSSVRRPNGSALEMEVHQSPSPRRSQGTERTASAPCTSCRYARYQSRRRATIEDLPAFINDLIHRPTQFPALEDMEQSIASIRAPRNGSCLGLIVYTNTRLIL
jgi:hypothetical protein